MQRSSVVMREGRLLLGLVFAVAVAGAVTAYGTIALCPCALDQGFAPATHDASDRGPLRYWTAAH